MLTFMYLTYISGKLRKGPPIKTVKGRHDGTISSKMPDLERQVLIKNWLISLSWFGIYQLCFHILSCRYPERESFVVVMTDFINIPANICLRTKLLIDCDRGFARVDSLLMFTVSEYLCIRPHFEVLLITHMWVGEMPPKGFRKGKIRRLGPKYFL